MTNNRQQGASRDCGDGPPEELPVLDDPGHDAGIKHGAPDLGKHFGAVVQAEVGREDRVADGQPVAIDGRGVCGMAAVAVGVAHVTIYMWPRCRRYGHSSGSSSSGTSEPVTIDRRGTCNIAVAVAVSVMDVVPALMY